MEPRVLEELKMALPAVNRYALRLTRDRDSADDLVQDCVERAITNIDAYFVGTNMRSWLFTILHNIFCDKMRQKQRRGVHIELNESLICDQRDAGPAEADAIRDLERAFRQLSPSDQQILLSIAVDGLSYEQAADKLNIALGTVKSRLFRARERLRALQQEHDRRRSERPDVGLTNAAAA